MVFTKDLCKKTQIADKYNANNLTEQKNKLTNHFFYAIITANWRDVLMRFTFGLILCSILATATIVHAEGLPANPWAAKQEVIGDTVLHVTRDDINRPNPAQNRNINSSQDMQELQNIAASIKEKWNNSTTNQAQQQQQQQNNEDDVNAIDAVNALNTLSRYMNKSNDNSTDNNTSSSQDMSALKQKLSDMLNKSKSASSQQNSQTARQMNKAKYEYNRYKSQLNSNYNTLKNKAKPVIDTMKKSVQEAEKASGIKF